MSEQMIKRQWTKLDNAAKAFPPTAQKSDTRVFRFSCELFEDVDEKLLQTALDKVLKEFPHFLCVLRQGFFWYYLEQSELRPVVKQESRTPCAELYRHGYRNLLFRVTYYKKRINLEIFHSLADGSGAVQFLRSLVLNYIIEKHGEDFHGAVPYLDSTSSVSEKSRDSFTEYYQNGKEKRTLPSKKAFIFKGPKRDDDSVLVIEGRVSVKAMLDLAHRYHTTLTGFVTAVFIYSVGMEMSVRNRNLPVVIGIPVNLRKYFSSQTARNFFAMSSIEYQFSSADDSFESIVEAVDRSMKENITKERLAEVMNSFAQLEHNFIVRIAPLPLKDLVISAERNKRDNYSTSVVSNLGAITMPEAVRPYINAFSVISSTLVMQLCLCSYEDKLDLGFTTALVDTELQKNFFRTLTKMGLEVELFCSDFDEDGGDENAVL